MSSKKEKAKKAVVEDEEPRAPKKTEKTKKAVVDDKQPRSSKKPEKTKKGLDEDEEPRSPKKTEKTKKGLDEDEEPRSSKEKEKTKKGKVAEEDGDASSSKKKKKTKKTKDEDEDSAPGHGNHVKILHLVWFGSGQPGIADANFVNMWAGLADGELGFDWEVYLWSDGTPRDWIPAGVTYKNISDMDDQMSAAMGEDEWRKMVEIVKDETTPTKVLKAPKTGTEEATLKIIQDMTTAGGKKRRTLGNGANFAAASDIIRAAVLYCFGGFYTDMASYPGRIDAEIQDGTKTCGREELASRFAMFVKVADVAPGTATTVLWVPDGSDQVNNAFLGSSMPMNPFYLYFLKCMHNIYQTLVYHPDVKSTTAYFTKFAKGKAKVNKEALTQRLASDEGFMRTLKRYAARALTLYTTGPYLLRSCLFHFFHESKAAPSKVLTVEQICQYIVESEDKPNDSSVRVAHKTATEKKSRKEKRPVHYQQQNVIFIKVQRGSWDQDAVQDYFVDVYSGREAKDRTLLITIPEDVQIAVTRLRTEVELALVTRHLDNFYKSYVGDEQENSYFIRKPLKEEDRATTGYKDFLDFCKAKKIENTLNLYNKLFELEPKRNKYPQYMKMLAKIWEKFLQEGAKLAVVGEMDKESASFSGFVGSVRELDRLPKVLARWGCCLHL